MLIHDFLNSSQLFKITLVLHFQQQKRFISLLSPYTTTTTTTTITATMYSRNVVGMFTRPDH
jgi:hypothetical protein